MKNKEWLTFKDNLIEQDGDYRKFHRSFFIEGEPLDNEGIEVWLETFDGKIADDRLSGYSITENCFTSTTVSKYLSNCAIGFNLDSDGGVLTFYMRDPTVNIKGDFRQGKMLTELVYSPDGVLKMMYVYQLPRSSFSKMAVQIGLEKQEREDLSKKVIVEACRDPIVSNLPDVLKQVEVAMDALDATSHREIYRMDRSVDFGGFTEHEADYYVNLDGQNHIQYGKEARFFDRLIRINRHDKDKDLLSFTQTSLAPGHYKSFIFTFPIILQKPSIDLVLAPYTRLWKDFYDSNKIDGSVEENSIE